MDDQAREFCVLMRSRLVGTLTLMCGDRHVAEELAQETLVRAWSQWPKVQSLGDQGAAAWTYRVAINLGNSWIRRRIAERRAVARIRSREPRAHSDPDTADAVAVRRAVVSLPVRQRTALALRYYADLPITEVAELMGCAPGTVKALTHQAMAGLRKELIEAEVHDG